MICPLLTSQIHVFSTANPLPTAGTQMPKESCVLITLKRLHPLISYTPGTLTWALPSSLFLFPYSETCRLFSSFLGVSFDVPLLNKHFLATLTQGRVSFLSASQCPVCMILMASLQCPRADPHFLLDCCLLEAGIMFYSPHIPSIRHILGIWQVFCKGLLTE